MGMKNLISTLRAALFLLLLLPIMAQAQSAKIDENQLFKFKTPPIVPEIKKSLPARRVGVYWSGLHIADLYTEIKPSGADTLQMKAIIRSYGIAKAITQYKSETISTIRRKGNAYQPETVSIGFKMRYGSRHIDMVYDAEGNMKSEKNVPGENRAKRKEVPAVEKKGVFDPLSAVLEARARVIAIMSGAKPDKKFTLPMYDGRRLSTLKFEVLGLDKEGRVHLTLSEEPKAGWTGNELKEKKARKPVIHIYLDAEDYLPVRAVGESKVGSSYGVLEATCATLEECM